jgi:hypothetical protein
MKKPFWVERGYQKMVVSWQIVIPIIPFYIQRVFDRFRAVYICSNRHRFYPSATQNCAGKSLRFDDFPIEKAHKI